MEYWLEILAGFLFTHELVVSEIERVNAANEYDFWYKPKIGYLPYRRLNMMY